MHSKSSPGVYADTDVLAYSQQKVYESGEDLTALNMQDSLLLIHDAKYAQEFALLYNRLFYCLACSFILDVSIVMV